MYVGSPWEGAILMENISMRVSWFSKKKAQLLRVLFTRIFDFSSVAVAPSHFQDANILGATHSECETRFMNAEQIFKRITFAGGVAPKKVLPFKRPRYRRATEDTLTNVLKRITLLGSVKALYKTVPLSHSNRHPALDKRLLALHCWRTLECSRVPRRISREFFGGTSLERIILLGLRNCFNKIVLRELFP